MAETRGIVEGYRDGRCAVRCERKCACSGCPESASCRNASLAEGSRPQVVLIRTDITDLKPGEEVLVVSDERLITAASIIDYAVPLVTAIVFLAAALFLRLSDPVTALAAGIGLVLGFFLSGIAGRRFARGRKLIEIRRYGGCPGEREVG